MGEHRAGSIYLTLLRRALHIDLVGVDEIRKKGLDFSMAGAIVVPIRPLRLSISATKQILRIPFSRSQPTLFISQSQQSSTLGSTKKKVTYQTHKEHPYLVSETAKKRIHPEKECNLPIQLNHHDALLLLGRSINCFKAIQHNLCSLHVCGFIQNNMGSMADCCTESSF